jgi:2',3'-cyclic-nucleotide 2'-phosphodiesterase (5'-nucleotidase family)
VNTGSVRAGLQAGEVTYGDLFTMQPFQDDYVDTFSLTGAQVWALLQQQLAPGTGGIMQVAGLKFTYSGSTITAVMQTDGTPIPNDTSKSYTGTANSFMIGGGDGFTVLEGASNIVQTADAELVPLVNYVGTLPNPFTYTTDGRITKS